MEGGKALCTGVPTTDPLKKGSSLVKINGKGVMRIGDGTGHGGKIAMVAPTLKAD